MDSFVKIITKIFLYLGFFRYTFSIPLDSKKSFFELSIIHFNDFHARYLPVSQTNGICHENERCVGGIARISTITRRLKRIRPNAIVLNAGDNFQGTLYFDIHRSNMTIQFMNQLPHDALTVGNHEFDDKLSGLKTYVERMNAPVVVTNIDATLEPSLQNFFSNSTIIRRGGKNIGVIGVTNRKKNTQKVSKTTGKLKFLDQVETINLEAAKLKSKGVNVIVVLSHSGISVDKAIAGSCPDVDVVVGGHSHTLLYNGAPPAEDRAYGEYPIVIKQAESNRQVLVVQAGAYTKYMGDIRIRFDERDEVLSWEGNPIYLDSSVEEDPAVVRELELWREPVDRLGKQVIGRTEVFLDAFCPGECTLGSLVTDAMLDAYIDENATISLFSANSLQNSIPVGPILYEDVYMMLSHDKTWQLIELRGSDLLQVLEESIAGKYEVDSFFNSGLLLSSGLKVVYDLTNENPRVASVQVRCLLCNGTYEDLNEESWYRIVVTSYLTSATFKAINKNHWVLLTGTYGFENMIDYIKKIKVVNVQKESRITFIRPQQRSTSTDLRSPNALFYITIICFSSAFI